MATNFERQTLEYLDSFRPLAFVINPQLAAQLESLIGNVEAALFNDNYGFLAQELWLTNTPGTTPCIDYMAGQAQGNWLDNLLFNRYCNQWHEDVIRQIANLNAWAIDNGFPLPVEVGESLIDQADTAQEQADETVGAGRACAGPLPANLKKAGPVCVPVYLQWSLIIGGGLLLYRVFK